VSVARTGEGGNAETGRGGDLDAGVREVFGERAAMARAYADLLVKAGIERGLLGPHEADRVWDRHLFNSAALAPLVPAGVHVVDLGSGAGLPGIPLAIARADLTVTLLEPMSRRVAFLHDCLETLELSGVRVVRGRAEDGGVPPAQVVVARAVASLEKLMRLSLPLLAADGVLLALKGQAAAAELDQVIRTQAVSGRVCTLSSPGGPATVVELRRPAGSSTAPARKGSRTAMRGSR
jgi:16S rRNA (guanine527-N7)-methyltransferase